MKIIDILTIPAAIVMSVLFFAALGGIIMGIENLIKRKKTRKERQAKVAFDFGDKKSANENL